MEKYRPKGGAWGPWDRTTCGSHCSSAPSRLVRKGARGQEGHFQRRSWDTAFLPVPWERETKEAWMGMCPPVGGLGRRLDEALQPHDGRLTSDQQGSVRWPAKGSTVSLLGVFAPNFSVMLEG